MGTYNNSVDDLVGVIWSALDEVEGDFDRATLHAALKKCRDYQPTTDDHLKVLTWWKPWTWCQGYWRAIRLNARLKTRLKETVYLQQRERLVQALKEYATHRDGCQVFLHHTVGGRMPSCTCGLAKAVEGLILI